MHRSPESLAPPYLREEVFRLTPAEALIVVRTMLAHLNERPVEFSTNLRARLSTSGRLAGTGAQLFLQQWIVQEVMTPMFQQEWTSAIQAARSQAGLVGSPPTGSRSLLSASANVPQRSAPLPPELSTIEQQILALSAPEALRVAQLMYPKLSDRSSVLQQRMIALVASEAALNAENAKSFLVAWLRGEDPSPQVRSQWLSAIGTRIVRGRSYSRELQEAVLALKPGPALSVAKLMYPKIAERPATLQGLLVSLVPSAEALTERNAGTLLSRWITLESATEPFETEWRSALASLPR